MTSAPQPSPEQHNSFGELYDHIDAIVNDRLKRSSLYHLDPNTRRSVEQLALQIPHALLRPALHRITTCRDPERRRTLVQALVDLFLPASEPPNRRSSRTS